MRGNLNIRKMFWLLIHTTYSLKYVHVATSK